MNEHKQRIIDQFTKQAVPFSEIKALTYADSVNTLLELAAPSSDDDVLDVACGPGIIACAFAPRVKSVTGIDLTPAMLERAAALQAEKKLTNIRWDKGDVEKLPYLDGRFSITVTRFSFHHLTEPEVVLREMIRVTRPGGKIVLCDAFTTEDAAQAELYNRLEVLRDPSHARALSMNELTRMMSGRPLRLMERKCFRLGIELEEQIRASFPNPGHEEEYRRLVCEDVGKNRSGLDPVMRDGKVHISYPIVAFMAVKEA